MTVALGKGQALSRAWLDWPSAKSFSKKRKLFAESQSGQALGKFFLKKRKIFVESQSGRLSANILKKKKKKEKSLPRASQMGSRQRKRAR
jgi:hypothetical protein